MRKDSYEGCITKFLAKIKTNGSECWEWSGYKCKQGYGKCQFLGKNVGAHRVSYELFRGKIPDGLVIDHICRNRGCCNPTHLRAVTNLENIMCGLSPAIFNSKKTCCKRGHPFDAENTDLYTDPRGKKRRMCRSCRTKGVGHKWRNALTHCKHGHPFDEQNTYYRKYKDGVKHRMCKRCHSLSEARRQKRLKSKR